MNAMKLIGGAVLVLASALPARADTCWPANGVSLVTDNKAWRMGDVVTVIVLEESAVSSEAGSNLAKSSDTEAKLEAVDIPGARLFPKDAVMPHVKGSAARHFDGKGTYEQKGTMTTRLTAVVTEVLPNGNLVIDGSRVRDSDGEKVVVRISGIVRPQDISSANTVLSTAVAQGKIVFESSGPVARSSRRGFFGKIVDFVWPF